MDGLERIKILSSETTNKPVLKIVDYLLSREDMNDKYLNEEKSLKQMLSFIKSKAQKQQEDGCAILEDEEVYSLAIHYWDESNEKLNLTPNKKEEVEKVNNQSNKDTNLIEKSPQNTNKKEWVPEGQLSLF